MKQVLILTGHYAGKTIKFGHHRFVNGKLELTGASHELDGAIKYLGRSYQAFPTGSNELAKAQERDAKKDHDNGIQHRNQEGVEVGGPERVLGERSSAAGQLQTAESVQGGNPVSSSTGEEGILPDGSGRSDAGLLPEEIKAIQSALEKLDPSIDEQWTAEGLPTVEVVAQISGNRKMNRAMVEAVAPKFNREAAQDARDLSSL